MSDMRDTTDDESDSTDAVRRSSQLKREREQTVRTVMALIKRRDRIHYNTGEDPLDDAGAVIKAAGMLRDQLPPEDQPRMEDVDPSEVFQDAE